MAGQMASFEGYSYRTSSRFGSRVKVSVDSATVSVTGPRVGILVYRLWIAVQVVLFWLIVPALLAAVVLWDWRVLLLALALAVAHWAVGGACAGCLWEMANLVAFMSGTKGKTTTFPVSAVKDVKIGRGWARKGLWLVIPPYVAGINKMAEGHCVSFEAPDGDTGRDAVYAFHMRTKEDAWALAKLLEGKESAAQQPKT